MDMDKYQELWLEQAKEERRKYDSLPVSDLLDDIRKQRYGDYYGIWHSLAERADLAQAGLILLEVLESDAPKLVRSHCASALISLAQLYKDDWLPEHLAADRKHPVKENLRKVRRIIEDKLRLGDQAVKAEKPETGLDTGRYDKELRSASRIATIADGIADFLRLDYSPDKTPKRIVNPLLKDLEDELQRLKAYINQLK